MAGLECDVICYDYYHIMTCPEWEDADFEGEIEDHFFPDWRSANLNGFKRPTWFAQGPTRFCIYYLISRRDGKRLRSWFWWNILKITGKLVVLRTKRNPFTRAIFQLLKGMNNLTFSLTHLLFSRVVVSAPFSRGRSVTSGAILKDGCTNEYSFDRQVDQLAEKWMDIFPDREDKFSSADVENYRSMIGLWRNLFSRYDIIQGYATDPILPLLAGKAYYALEHGTLREIPFQRTIEGRITALSYSLAEHVFVTNGDCLENAHELADDRVSFINHPFDEDHGLNVNGWQDLRKKLADLLDAEFVFFFPTRHDWVSGAGYGDKGNDIFLRAFCRLRQDGYRVGMICCRWGANVEESVILLRENGCHQHAAWWEPMGTVKFERAAKACDIVVDQFKLGFFGGIMFKAMAVGAPVCTYLDEAHIHKWYDEIPPVINCRTEEEIVSRLTDIIEKPSMLQDVSLASRDWIKKNHNALQTMEVQLLNYQKYMEKSGKDNSSIS
jgi:hypothetical protein